ncbi:MAG: hypothetical protein KatS3mg002_0306 [Candidatus Woesearchaeota archaeon]|nr:MAG: hypothetical protein KatS3mg002_0306 [Candidatus Woesearchaeota archaeon]
MVNIATMGMFAPPAEQTIVQTQGTGGVITKYEEYPKPSVKIISISEEEIYPRKDKIRVLNVTEE